MGFRRCSQRKSPIMVGCGFYSSTFFKYYTVLLCGLTLASMPILDDTFGVVRRRRIHVIGWLRVSVLTGEVGFDLCKIASRESFEASTFYVRASTTFHQRVC